MLKTDLACKRVVGTGLGLKPHYLLWIYDAIVKLIFLHGSVVWWKYTTSDSNKTYLSRLNRLAAMTISGAFKTTPTAALEHLLHIKPLHIHISQTAMSTCYRLLYTGNWDIRQDIGHCSIYHSLASCASQSVMPSDHLIKYTSFNLSNITFQIPTRDHGIMVKSISISMMYVPLQMAPQMI